jgi:hypothetical protein
VRFREIDIAPLHSENRRCLLNHRKKQSPTLFWRLWRLEKIDEALLHLPAGHAFSHGGEAASRTCLHKLKALLETVG